MAKTAAYKCCCGASFEARVADRNRGWARFCSKSCKAHEQEGRTHQYHDFQNRQEECHEEDPSWDAHKDAF